MKFVLISRNQGEDKTWREGYYDDEITDLKTAHIECSKMIAAFNSTLRPLEKPRELVDVVEALETDHCVPTHNQRMAELDAEEDDDDFSDEDEDENDFTDEEDE